MSRRGSTFAHSIEAPPLDPPGPPTLEECKRHAALAWHDGTAVRLGFAALYPNPGEDRLSCVVSRGRYGRHNFEVFIWGSPAAEFEGQVVRKSLSHEDEVFDHDILLHLGEVTIAALSGGMPAAREPVAPLVYQNLDKPLGFFASIKRRWQLWRASRSIGGHLAKVEADRVLRSKGADFLAGVTRQPDVAKEMERQINAGMRRGLARKGKQ